MVNFRVRFNIMVTAKMSYSKSQGHCECKGQYKGVRVRISLRVSFRVRSVSA